MRESEDLLGFERALPLEYRGEVLCRTYPVRFLIAQTRAAGSPFPAAIFLCIIHFPKGERLSLPAALILKAVLSDVNYLVFIPLQEKPGISHPGFSDLFGIRMSI